MMSIVGEVKDRAISYLTIPYFNGLRVDTQQDGYNNTSVVLEGKDG